jgi:protein phosphatase
MASPNGPASLELEIARLLIFKHGSSRLDPDLLTSTTVERLRTRNIGAKRSLAVGDFALGIEALERFVAKEPLRRIHECVFGVLALESEPIYLRL